MRAFELLAGLISNQYPIDDQMKGVLKLKMEMKQTNPCWAIEHLLRRCLEATGNQNAIPNNSRCFWAPTIEESVACWCR